jgi:hypothetical protein
LIAIERFPSRLIAAYFAVHHQIVPIAGAPLGFTQHAFTSEAGLLQRALLREIRDIR